MRAAADRRLAAVVFTDVVGYSALMQADEARTIAAVREDLERMRTLCGSRGGTCLNSMGDGLMLAFASAVDAVAFATEAQAAFAQRNLAAALPVRHRIGIHIGDVVELPDGTMAGDGVNIASRLEGKAPPGGICMSQSVYDTVRGKLQLEAVDGGAQSLKNIGHPVHVWTVAMDGQPKGRRARWHRAPVTALAAVALAVVLAAVAWPFAAKRSAAPGAGDGASSTGSVVLLPVSPAAPQDQALADAISQDMAAMLARSSSILRVAVPSPRQVRAAEGDGPALAQLQRVRFAVQAQLEGSGSALALNIKLADAATRQQLWAERDALPGDDAQRRRTIHDAMWRLRGAILGTEMKRATVMPDGSGEPVDDVLRAIAVEASDLPPRERIEREARLYESALARDPQLMAGLLGMAFVVMQQLDIEPQKARQERIRRMDDATAQAVSLGDSFANAWYMRAHALMLKNDWDAAVQAAQKALQLEPDSAGILALNADMMLLTGKLDASLDIARHGENAMHAELEAVRCQALLFKGNAAQAAASCDKARGLRKRVDPALELITAAAYQAGGDTARARRTIEDLRQREPQATIDYLRLRRDSSHPAFVKLAEERLYPPLRQAGLPEQ